MLARILAASGQHQAGFDLALRAIALDRTQASSAILVAQIAAMRGEFDLAAQALDHALEVCPTPETMVMRGDADLARGDEAAAMGCYRRAMAFAPAFPGSYLNAAILLERQGASREAIAVLEAGLAAGATPAPLWYNLGNRRYHLGDHPAAIAAFEAAAVAAPTAPEPLLNLALTHESQGNLIEAARILRHAQTIAPDHSVVRGNLAAVLTELNHLEDACALFASVIAQAPDEPRFRLGYAIAAFKRHDFELAERQARHAVRLPQAHNLLAQIFLARGQHDSGIIACAAALAISPDYAEARVTQAQLMLAKGDHDAAERLIDEALALKPDYPGALVNRGLILQGRAQIQDAMECFDRALVLDPCCKEAMVNRASLLLTMGQIPEAIDAYRQALVHHPQDALLWMGLANALGEQGDIDACLEAYDRAIAYDPDYPANYWNKALALMRIGRVREAWEYFDHRFAAGAVQLRAYPQIWWRGEALDGRSIMVWAEQGIGDQIALSPLAIAVSHRARTCFLAVDSRLVTLFQRSLGPRITCLPLEEGVHCTAELQTATGSIAQYLTPRPPGQPVAARWLVCDPVRADPWRHWLETLGERPCIGICWRSALRSIERDKSYADLLTDWPVLLRGLDVTWIDLQYDGTGKESAALAQATGITLQRPPGLDQYHDLEGVAALLANIPVVISAPTALAQLAIGVGVETHIVTDRGATVPLPEPGQAPRAFYCAARQQMASWHAIFARLHQHFQERLPGLDRIRDNRPRVPDCLDYEVL